MHGDENPKERKEGLLAPLTWGVCLVTSLVGCLSCHTQDPVSTSGAWEAAGEGGVYSPEAPAAPLHSPRPTPSGRQVSSSNGGISSPDCPPLNPMASPSVQASVCLRVSAASRVLELRPECWLGEAASGTSCCPSQVPPPLKQLVGQVWGQNLLAPRIWHCQGGV